MQKFEINNPEALKFIADFKSGVLFQPIIEKIKKIKWILISIALFITFLIFYGFGKALSNRNKVPVFLPPDLSTPQVSTAPKQSSQFDSLKSEIFEFSTDLPDPVMPDLNNSINFQKEEI